MVCHFYAFNWICSLDIKCLNMVILSVIKLFIFYQLWPAESFLLRTGPHTVSFLKIQACQILEFETLTLDNMCVLPPCYENHSLYLPFVQRIVNAEQAWRNTFWVAKHSSCTLSQMKKDLVIYCTLRYKTDLADLLKVCENKQHYNRFLWQMIVSWDYHCDKNWARFHCEGFKNGSYQFAYIPWFCVKFFE